MADPQAPRITIALSRPVMLELARMARDSQRSEGALIQEAVEALVQARHSPGIPRYARRIGPITLAAGNRDVR
jgi:hypothetical protein